MLLFRRLKADIAFYTVGLFVIVVTLWAFNQLAAKDIKLLMRIGLNILLLGVLSATTFTTVRLTHSASRWGGLNLTSLTHLLLAAVAGLGAALGVAQWVSPANATQADVENVGTKIDDLSKKIAPDEAAVRDMLPGVWGNDECSAVFEFSLAGDVLIVRSLRQPPNAKPYNATASVITAKGLVMKTQNESDDIVTTLQVTPANTVPKLSWQNGDKPAVTLGRCSA